MILVQFIAHLLVVVLMILLTLANYWYAFGLWPVSWAAFVLCSLGNIVLIGLSAAINAAGRKS